MSQSMNELRDILLQLDAQGARVTELRAQIEELPRILERAEAQLLDLQERHADAVKRSKEAQSEAKDKEHHIEQDQERLNRVRSNLDRATSQRQLDAMNEEIEQLLVRMDDNTEAALLAMDEAEHCAEEIRQWEEEIEESVATRDRAQLSLTEDAPRLSAELDSALALGEKLLASLPDTQRKAFLRARGKEGVPSLPPSNGDSCGRCHTIIPAQLVNETRALKAFHACPQCLALINPWE